jgi:hypothetical protein
MTGMIVPESQQPVLQITAPEVQERRSITPLHKLRMLAKVKCAPGDVLPNPPTDEY